MKMITDYEVEGCWRNPNSKEKCRLCGTLMQPVPKEGHFNSQYLELARDDGMILECCPKGCNVKEAEERMTEFMKIRYYCAAKSASWCYKLDYNKIQDAWIDRQGNVYPVAWMGHIDFAYERNADEATLENNGWLKLTAREFFWRKKLSQAQIDMIFDYIQITGTKKDIKKFQEEIDRDSSYFKLEKSNVKTD